MRRAYGFADEPKSSTLDVPQTEDDPTLNFLPESLLNGGRHDLDTLRVLDQQNYPSARAKRHAHAGNVSLVITEDGKIASRLSASAFRNGQTPNYVPPEFPNGAKIWLYFQNDPLFQLYSAVDSALFYERYLVFIDHDAPEVEPGTKTLSFIDLSYNRASLGTDAPLPIFYTPVVNAAPDAHLHLKDGVLYLGEQPIPLPVVHYLSSIHQLATHLTISAVDPETHADLADVVPEMVYLFERAAEIAGEDTAQQAELLSGQNMARTLVDGVKQVLSQAPIVPVQVDELPPEAWPNASNEMFRRATSAMGKNLVVQRSLLSRVQLIWSRMTLPQPEKTPQLREALALVAGGVVARNSALFREGMLHAFHHPLTKWGTPVVAAFIYGYYHPEVAGYLYQGLDITRTVLQTVLYKTGHVGEVFLEAAKVTLSGPANLHQAYVANGRFPKLLVGLTAAFVTLGLTLGIPRLVVNTACLIRDLRRGIPIEEIETLPPDGWRRILGTWKAKFIARQEGARSARAESQARRSAERLGVATRTFTDDENAYINEVISELEKKQVTWTSKCFDKIKRWPLVRRLFGRNEATGSRRIENFRGALMHFLFSAASFQEFVNAFTVVGKKIYGATAFIANPTAMLTTLIYPNYSRTILHGLERSHLPTDINGGLRNVWDENRLRVAGLFGNPLLESLRIWEARIVPVEAAIQEEVVRYSFHALRRFITDTNELNHLVSIRGIDGVTDDDFYTLTANQRSFLRAYMEKLQDRAMQIYLARLASEKVNCGGAAEMTSGELKRVTLACADSLSITSATAGEIVREAVSRFDIFGETLRDRMDWTDALPRFKRAWNHYHARHISPHRNVQMEQMGVVDRQSRDPFAMSRVTGTIISSNIVDKPMELIGFLVLLAGNFKGINVPIHDEMFSKDAFFYLGRFPIYACFMGGLLTSLLSDIRMKLQQDTLNEEQFGRVPQGEDAKRGYLSWYWQFFRDPKNSLWENHKLYVRILSTHLTTTLTLMGITSLITLGRIDLENMVTSMFALYCVPIGALAFKMDRAFEMASGWPLRNIDPEYHSHPSVQEFRERAVLSLRLAYAVPAKLIENISWFIVGNAETLDTEKFGTRSLARIFFNGHLPTDYAVSFLRKIASSFGAVPGVKKAANFCVQVLINNRTDAAQ